MDEALNPSVLGTLQYWDDAYQSELQNFNSHGDVGEVWFGESVSKRILKWMVNSPNIAKNANIIDVGCGNGMFLIELSKKEYTSLHGVDYSKNAIDLAQNIAQNENCNVNFTVGNILECSVASMYDVVLDKGTFDAISLHPEDSKSKREKYIHNVWNMLKTEGILLITSCNWSEEELKNQFKSCFNYVETLPTSSFTFGGQKGNTVSSVVFKKI